MKSQRGWGVGWGDSIKIINKEGRISPYFWCGSRHCDRGRAVHWEKKKKVLLSWRNMFATLLKQTLSGPLLPFLPLRLCVCTSACVNVTHSRWSLVGASCAKKDTSNYRFWSRLRQLPIPKIYPSQNCLSSKFGSIRTSPAVWVDFKKKKRGHCVALAKTFELRILIFTILTRWKYKLGKTSSPEHCLRLDRWQGPPHVNNVNHRVAL